MPVYTEGLGHRKDYTCLLEKTGSGSSVWAANHPTPTPGAWPGKGSAPDLRTLGRLQQLPPLEGRFLSPVLKPGG